MTRLQTIADRQRKLRTRDLVFAAFMSFAAITGVLTLI